MEIGILYGKGDLSFVFASIRVENLAGARLTLRTGLISIPLQLQYFLQAKCLYSVQFFYVILCTIFQVF